MECNYAAPLSDPSNAEFQLDIVNWSKVSNRIFIWDYTSQVLTCIWDCYITSFDTGHKAVREGGAEPRTHIGDAI
jgi:hypothetical protein